MNMCEFLISILMKSIPDEFSSVQPPNRAIASKDSSHVSFEPPWRTISQFKLREVLDSQDKNHRISSIAFPGVDLIAVCFKDHDEILIFDLESLLLQSRLRIKGDIKFGTFRPPNNHWLLINAHDKSTKMKNGVRLSTIMVFDIQRGSFLDVDLGCQVSDVHAFGDRYISLFLGDNQTGFEVRDIMTNSTIRMSPKSGDKHFSHEICALDNGRFATQVWGQRQGIAIFSFTVNRKFRVIPQQNIMHFVPIDTPLLATLHSTETECCIAIWNYDTLTKLQEFPCSYTVSAKLCHISSRVFEILLVHSEDKVVMERWNWHKGLKIDSLPKHECVKDAVTRWCSDVRGNVVGILGEDIVIYRFTGSSQELKNNLCDRMRSAELIDIVIIVGK